MQYTQPISASREETSVRLIVCAVCPTSWTSQLVLAEFGGFKAEFPCEKRVGLRPYLLSYGSMAQHLQPPCGLWNCHLSCAAGGIEPCCFKIPENRRLIVQMWNQARIKISVTLTESGSLVMTLFPAITVWIINYLRCDLHKHLAKRKSYHHPFFSVNKQKFPSKWITWGLTVTVNLPMQT